MDYGTHLQVAISLPATPVPYMKKKKKKHKIKNLTQNKNLYKHVSNVKIHPAPFCMGNLIKLKRCNMIKIKTIIIIPTNPSNSKRLPLS